MAHRRWFLECKPWSKLEKLAQRYPRRYQLDHDKCWRAPLIEHWLAERGIGYRIQSDRDIPQSRIENTLFLEDYLDPSAPPCPVDAELRAREALAADAAQYLAELYEKAECRPDDAFKLIAYGQLVAEIDYASLSLPARRSTIASSCTSAFSTPRHLRGQRVIYRDSLARAAVRRRPRDKRRAQLKPLVPYRSPWLPTATPASFHTCERQWPHGLIYHPPNDHVAAVPSSTSRWSGNQAGGCRLRSLAYCRISWCRTRLPAPNTERQPKNAIRLPPIQHL